MEDRQLKPCGGRASLALLLPLAAVLLAERAQAEDPPPPEVLLQIPGLPPLRVPAEAAAPEAAAPPPSAVDRNQVHREAVEVFDQLDVDHDGGLQPVETFNLASEAFAAADRDHDGRISIVEWVDARFAELEAQAPAPQAAAPQAAAPAPPGPALPSAEKPPEPAE